MRRLQLISMLIVLVFIVSSINVSGKIPKYMLEETAKSLDSKQKKESKTAKTILEKTAEIFESKIRGITKQNEQKKELKKKKTQKKDFEKKHIKKQSKFKGENTIVGGPLITDYKKPKYKSSELVISGTIINPSAKSKKPIKKEKKGFETIVGDSMYADTAVVSKKKPPKKTLELVKKLRDNNWVVRMKAVEALGDMKELNAVGRLKNTLLNDKNNDVRISAVIALSKIGGPIAIDALQRASKDKDERIKKLSIQILKNMGIIKREEIVAKKPDVKELIKRLKDKSELVRERAAQSLGELENAEAVPELIKALNDKSIGVRIRSVMALRDIKDPRAINALTRLVKKEKIKGIKDVADQALVELKKPVEEKIILS